MKKRIEDILWVLVENAPAVLTVAFAAYVIALSQSRSISTELLLQWILAILGLLAISGLIERWRKLRHIENVSEQTLKVVQSRFSERVRSEDFFTKRLPALEPYLSKATDIRLSGYSLQRTMRENRYIIAQRLKDGASLRVLMVNPKLLKGIPLVSEPGEKHDPLGSIMTLKNLSWLSKQPDSKGKVEVKFTDEEPRFNILAIDSEEPLGVIFVEFYPQRWVHGSRPRMELTPERDNYWYHYFRKQFDLVWEGYQEVSVDGQLDLRSDTESPVSYFGS